MATTRFSSSYLESLFFSAATLRCKMDFFVSQHATQLLGGLQFGLHGQNLIRLEAGATPLGQLLLGGVLVGQSLVVIGEVLVGAGLLSRSGGGGCFQLFLGGSQFRSLLVGRGGGHFGLLFGLGLGGLRGGEVGLEIVSLLNQALDLGLSNSEAQRQASDGGQYGKDKGDSVHERELLDAH